MITRRMITRRILLCSLLMLAARPALAQEAWTRYHNARYGTSIDYQEFFEPGRPPDNGDGLAFTGPEGANFTVFGRYNTNGETPATTLKDLAADADHQSITYKAIHNNRLTISGLRGELIYYEIYLFSAKGIIHTFAIEYQAKWKRDYDPTIKRMAKSFSGP